jgi:geranylgeranyl pyrophosphate synthase
LHVSSLIHDDIIDNSLTRRGFPSTYIKFGLNDAIFGANYLVGRAGRNLSKLQSIEIYQIFSTIMDNLTSGEYIQARKNKNISNF